MTPGLVRWNMASLQHNRPTSTVQLSQNELFVSLLGFSPLQPCSNLKNLAKTQHRGLKIECQTNNSCKQWALLSVRLESMGLLVWRLSEIYGNDEADVASAALFLLVKVQECCSLLTPTVGPLSPCWTDMKLDWFAFASRKGFCTSKTAVNSELNPHRKQHSSTLHLVEKKTQFDS